MVYQALVAQQEAGNQAGHQGGGGGDPNVDGSNDDEDAEGL